MTSVNVVGAGIVGLWQTYCLMQRGIKVKLFEQSKTPFADAASSYAGAMLAPYCECEPSEKLLLELGAQSLELWRAAPFDVSFSGTLVMAAARDAAELEAFAHRTSGHEFVENDELKQLEPDIASRFRRGLFYALEAHLAPRELMAAMLQAIQEGGVVTLFGEATEIDQVEGRADYTIDCRGMGARFELDGLRSVRGEMAVVKTRDIKLRRPVRLLHPRIPCYIVPWPDDHYMIGATVIESDDDGPVTLRSALELLGSAFSVHPGFGDAKIVELSAGLRPAFSDNMPKIQTNENIISVNGVYRNGFLLGPLLGELVADYIVSGKRTSELFQ